MTVPGDASGTRLDVFLAEYFAESDEHESLSRSRIQKLIEASEVVLGERQLRPSLRLHGGEVLWVTIPAPQPLELVPEPIDLEVLHEDGDIIVINKPAGLVVHPGAGHATGTLVHGLLHHCRDLSGIGGALRPGIVHRLDRLTSGVMVVAKTDAAHAGLARQFAERGVDKRYVAFVVGKPEPKSATIDTPYGRHPKDRKRFSSKVESGRRAVTTYEVVAAGSGASRLEVVLGTGRTHQIRVHLSDRGHPIIGDAVYGGRRLGLLSNGMLRNTAEQLERHALHAASLALQHPTAGERLTLDAPLPPELAALDRLIRSV